MLKRVILLLLGFVVIGSGVGMLRILDLGLDPFGVMVLGLSELSGLAFGTIMMILQVLIFLPVVAKKRSLVGVGTIIGMFGIGYIVDFFYAILSSLIQVEFTPVVRIIILIVTLVVVSLGVSLTIVANLGLIPYDALGLVIEATTHGKLKFNIARMGTDGLSAAIGFLLGATLGVATLLTVFTLGPIVNFFKNTISKAVGLEI